MKKRILILSLLAFAWQANAQNSSWENKTSAGYSYQTVSNDPLKARFYTLKNGLTVILTVNKKSPRVHCLMSVKAGAKNDPKENTGLAHYLEHMLFKGTSRLGSANWKKEKPELDKIDALYQEYNASKEESKRKAIYRKIDSVSNIASRYAIANEYDNVMQSIGGSGSNAFTTNEATVYTEDIPSTSVEQFLKIQAERFRDPVLRLFHTELEAVYEEKNIDLDSESDRIFEVANAEMFKKHNYGLQTIIGTVDHLKNPSLVAIRRFYNQYYKPNNMALVMSGDLDPDQVIALVEKHLGGMKAGPVEKYSFEPESPILSPIEKDIIGPGAENLNIFYRLPNLSQKEKLGAMMTEKILSNGHIGLIDLDLVKKQSVLDAGASFEKMKDYAYLHLYANPMAGQSLNEAKNLLLQEVEKLKQGQFDATIIKQIALNLKTERFKFQDKYQYTAYALNNSFLNEQDWLNDVNIDDDLSQLSKEDVVAFANKYLANNYVAIYKRKGEKTDVVKIEKPEITPINTNPNVNSAFYKNIEKMPRADTQPVFLDFDKDFERSKLGKAEVYTSKNKDNQLFRLSYRYKIGSLNDPQLSYATSLAGFLNSDKMSSEEISKAFYQLACEYSFRVDEEYTTVSIVGLQENFVAASQLFETIMTHYQNDQNAKDQLKSLIASNHKSRSDAKLDKAEILKAMENYASYGPKNKYNYVLSNAQLDALEAGTLINKLKNLNNYEQNIIYYGPLTSRELVDTLQNIHQVPQDIQTAGQKTEFKQAVHSKNEVLFANYDMVQAEIAFVSNASQVYDAKLNPISVVFNRYFGGGMSGLVFQTLRESKALAYGVGAHYYTPWHKNERYLKYAYIGTQADKFDAAIHGMNELNNHMPILKGKFQAAKKELMESIQTKRINDDAIIYNYLGLKELGETQDIRKEIYQKVPQLSLQDLKNFHAKYIANKPNVYCVLASDKKVTQKQLQKLGTVKILSLEELFGY